jgi:hypothetical protein
MKDENKIHDIHLELMARACSIVWGVDIKTNTRVRPMPYARACFYKLAKTQTKRPLTYIGSYLNKDHATVIHALNKFDAYQLTPDFNKKYDNCIKNYEDLLGESNELKEFYIESDIDFDTINRVLELQTENKALKIQNEQIVNKLVYFENKDLLNDSDFIEEIRNLEPEVKREFKEYRWKPFKRLLETRVKH